MNKTPELIVMLTHNDRTVENAQEIFQLCKDTKARFFGLKEEGLPLPQLKDLFSTMKQHGKVTVLEVVAYEEEACLHGARMAVECGCDYLMGTLFHDSVNAFCQAHHLRYLPFVGKITGRPSVLEGEINTMAAEAKHYLEKGVWGIDLLGYRYTGDPLALNTALVSQLPAPVCLAGSVNSFQRLDEVKATAPWAFTIGGAFFEHKFGDSIPAQIDRVWNYMQAPALCPV